jgi:PAS domain S-box-containing protein
MAALLSSNQSFKDMLGYDEDEIHELTYEDITPPKWHSKEARILTEQVLAEGYSEVYEKEYRRKDGRVIPVNLRTYSILDSSDMVSGFWSIVRDISVQKQVQSELIRAKEAAEVANRAKSRFLATMSHEIRTPMNAIIGMTNLTLDTGLTQEQKEYLTIVQSSADQLLLLIDEILDLSRIESGRMEWLYESFDLHERVNLIIKTLSPRAWEKGLFLIQEIDSDVPRHLVGDADRLRQVIYNLISNAIKFTDNGSVCLSINAVESGADRTVLHFAVMDTGIGIAADKLQEIFEPFSQADASTTRKYGGSGLGLAISRELVNMMGGKLLVDSQPGKGSTFRFELAFDLAEEELSGDSGIKEPLSEVEVPVVTDLSVLLAEDNLVNQKLAVALLEKRGHRVDVSLDGRQAVDMFTKGAYDLIFMDVEMPEMDGVEATKQIRRIESASGKRVPIIAMTAHAMMGDEERMLKSGMDAYLAKPIDFERLDRIIHKFYG